MLIWFKLDFPHFLIQKTKLNMLCVHVQRETECKHLQKAF